jgi:hypothetical protein
MLRLTELALFVVPLIIYAVWRATAATGGPPARALIAAGIAMALLAAALFWFATAERMEAGQVYVPPHLEGGQIIPGHVARP